MGLILKDIRKSYDGNVIFDNFNIEFSEGNICCILGASGCGKTSLLNIIGGILKPDYGNIEGIENKSISYIFQEPRLLPWKTVRDNIDFVLSREMDPSERKTKLDELLKLVDMESFADYYPSQLSGGMSQRVSLARAFALPSQIILMDEPLSGLDVSLKRNILNRFVGIWTNDRRTVIYVTHDIDEALMLGNEIFVIGERPVKVLLHKKIETALEKRNLVSPDISEIRNNILEVLK